MNIGEYSKLTDKLNPRCLRMQDQFDGLMTKVRALAKANNPPVRRIRLSSLLDALTSFICLLFQNMIPVAMTIAMPRAERQVSAIAIGSFQSR